MIHNGINVPFSFWVIPKVVEECRFPAWEAHVVIRYRWSEQFSMKRGVNPTFKELVRQCKHVI